MENEFLKMRKDIRYAVRKYVSIRECLGVESLGRSRTIRDLSKPFTQGYFTLAVIGKMSAGKSTFINALLGKRNLLATGFGQTTCTITEIMDSDEEYYEVVFADNSTKKFDSIEELKRLTSISSKYSDLPIKQINDLILEGCSFEQILENKETLEKNNGAPIDTEELEKYFLSHNISNIPEKVCVYTKLPNDFQGWKIVDTPGIAATGGIEDETYELLSSKDDTGKNNIIDAVIFVNSAATQIEDSTFQKFVRDTIESLPNAVRERLFLVRTHGANREYLRNKEQQVRESKKLFVEGLKIKENHMYVVDSLSYILLKYVNDEQIDLTSMCYETPFDWEDKMWEAAIDIVDDAVRSVRKRRLGESQETIEDQIIEWSNFKELTEALSAFVREEKSKVYKTVLDLIVQDLEVVRDQIKKKIDILSKNKGDLQGLKEALKEESRKGEKVQKELNDLFTAMQKDYSRSSLNKYFYDIESRVNSLSGSLEDMHKDMRRYMYDIKETQRSVFDSLAYKLDESSKDILKNNKVVMPYIDFSAIKQESVKDATSYVLVGYEKKKVIDDSFWGDLKRFFTFGYKGYKEVYDMSKPIKEKVYYSDDAEKKFVFRVQTAFNEMLENLKRDMGKLIDFVGKKASEELKKEIERIKESQKSLIQECEKTQKEEDVVRRYTRDFNVINDTIEKLRKYDKSSGDIPKDKSAC